MKNKILFSAMLCLACTFSVNVNAQLEVIQSGDVNATDQATNNNSGIIKKKLYNGVLIVESTGNMYNSQGMKLR